MMGAMRALAKMQAGPGLELVDRPEPTCGDWDVKIRVLRAGLCGTDLHLQQWDDWAASMVNAPQTIGHEFYGEIVEVGQDVKELQPGDKVSGEGHIVCGYCRNCRAGRRHQCIRTVGLGVNTDGALADYVVLPVENVWKHPDWVDPDLGAIFDPLGNATHTALQWNMAGEDVLVTGAGPIGVMAAAIARHAGARNIVVTDLSDYRLGLANAAGAALHAHHDRANGLIGEEDGAAPQPFAEMTDNMNHGGKIAMLGLPASDYAIDWGKVITHMLTIKGIYGREMFETWYLMTSMLSTSDRLKDAVRSVITHRFAAEDWEEAFATARAGQCGKVILDWS